MKNKIAVVALFLLIFTTSAFAALTVTDFEKIQSIVDKSAIRIEKSIETSEKKIKEYVDLKINALDGKLSGEINTLEQKFSGEFNTLNERINSVDSRLTQIYGFVIALVALIAIAVGIPHILVARQGKELRVQEQQIKTLQQEIEKLKHALTIES